MKWINSLIQLLSERLYPYKWSLLLICLTSFAAGHLSEHIFQGHGLDSDIFYLVYGWTFTLLLIVLWGHPDKMGYTNFFCGFDLTPFIIAISLALTIATAIGIYEWAIMFFS